MSGSVTGAGTISSPWPRYVLHPITGRDILVTTQAEEQAIINLSPQLAATGAQAGTVPPALPPSKPYGPASAT